jgi:hypothetical protein
MDLPYPYVRLQVCLVREVQRKKQRKKGSGLNGTVTYLKSDCKQSYSVRSLARSTERGSCISL